MVIVMVHTGLAERVGGGAPLSTKTRGEAKQLCRLDLVVKSWTARDRPQPDRNAALPGASIEPRYGESNSAIHQMSGPGAVGVLSASGRRSGSNAP